MTSGTIEADGTAYVTLDSNGNGTASVGPLTAREVWYPTTASVKTNQSQFAITNEAICNIYVGQSATQENFRDGTFSGSSGDSSDLVSGKLKSGNKVWAVWRGGDANVQATLVVSGTKEI